MKEASIPILSTGYSYALLKIAAISQKKPSVKAVNRTSDQQKAGLSHKSVDKWG